MQANILQQSLSNWKPQGEGPYQVTLPLTEPWMIKLDVQKVESLASSINRLTLSRTPQPSQAQGDLEKFATSLAKNLSKVLEPLQVIECDSTLNHAVLRSEISHSQNASIRYYEITVTSTNRVDLECFVFDRATDSRREKSPFILINETIVRFVDEVIKAAVD